MDFSPSSVPGVLPTTASHHNQLGFLIDTAQQVNEQLNIVRTLRQQNAEYLNDLEGSWIDHVLSSSQETVNRFGYLTEPVHEKARRRRRWMPDTTFFQQLRQLISDAPAATDDLTRLLIAAQSLNSAIGLLSSCYDRWKWMQTERGATVSGRPGQPSEELSQFLNRRRHGSGDRANRLVRLASVCMEHGNQIDRSETVRRIRGAGSKPDNCSDSDSDSYVQECRLSFIVIEAVEKWRQNAEDALSSTLSRCSMEVPDRGSIGFDVATQAAGIITEPQDGSSSLATHNAPTTHAQTIDVDEASQYTPVNTTLPPYRAYRRPSDSFAPQSSSRPNTSYAVRRKQLSRTYNSFEVATDDGSTKSTTTSSNHSVLDPIPETELRNGTGKEVYAPPVEELGKEVYAPPVEELGLLRPFSSPGKTDGPSLHGLRHASMSPVSHCSSTPSLGSTNMSTTSLDTMSPPLRPHRVSRGRAWLEREAERV